MPRPALIHLRTLDQFETLLSPARFEVFECMRFMAPCSIADIARWLDKPSDALYQHVRRLVDIGVATSAGFRKNGNHNEEMFDLTGDDVEFNSLRPPLADHVMKLVGDLFIRYARGTLQDAIRNKAIRYAEPDRNLIITNFLAWLSPQEYAKIRSLTKDIIGVINSARERQSGDLYMCMNMVCPVIRKKRGEKRPPTTRTKTKPRRGAIDRSS